MVAKRKMEVDEDEIMDKVKKSMPNRSIMLSTSNVCSECKNPVFISERILFMKKLYHRTCFRCSNCKNPLNPHIADVSPDGLLFCVETNCHLELLKQFHPVSPSKDESVVKVPQTDELQIENVTNPISKLPHEIEHALDSGEKENVPLHPSDLPKDKSPTPIQANDKISDLDEFYGDGQSQGDIQKPLIVPLCPNKKTNKLMNFAGAMIHAHQTDSDMDSAAHIQKSNDGDMHEENIMGDPQSTEMEHSNPVSEEVPSKEESLTTVNSTHEVTSIKDNAVLSVADRIKLFAAEKESKDIHLNDNSSEISINSVSEEPKVSKKSVESKSSPLSLETESSQASVQETEIPTSPEKNDESTAPEKKIEEETANPFKEDELGENANEPPPLPATPKPQLETNVTPVPSPRSRRRTPEPGTVSVTLPPMPSPVPRTRTKKEMENKKGIHNSAEELWKKKDYYPAELNPFESEEDVPGGTSSKKAGASLTVPKNEPKNPFEDDEDEDSQVLPSPKPRTSTPISNKLHEINNNGHGTDRSPGHVSSQNAANFNVPPPRPPPPQMSPRKTPVIVKPYNPFEDEDDDIGEYVEDKPSEALSRVADDTSSISSKTSDLSSISSVPTPIPRSLNTSDAEGHGSMKLKSRKSRRAPLPPSLTPTSTASTPSLPSLSVSSEKGEVVAISPSPTRKVIPVSPKLLKGLKSPSNQPYRKKRRAPPPRRRVDPLPEESIQKEFADLEVRQKELERQGIALESNIRHSMEDEPLQGDGSAEDDGDHHNEQLDEMIIQLWSIVNEKNDILRRQTELEYLRRGHRLEEMQAELEFKYRTLMDTPLDQRESNHADMEQILLQQVLKLVDERNEVVEWLDYHRQLDREEDMLVSKSLSEYSSSSKIVEPMPDASPKSKSKSKAEKKAEKAEAKAKLKEESSGKEKKKDGKLLKLGIFSKKKKSKSKTDEDIVSENVSQCSQSSSVNS